MRRGQKIAKSVMAYDASSFAVGDSVKSMLPTHSHIVGVVTGVDVKAEKVNVSWAGGAISHHDPEDLILIDLPEWIEERMAGNDIPRKLASRRFAGMSEGDDPQFAGDPKVHGIDKPRGGGFSIMQDLAEDLHEEAKEEAASGPKVASIESSAKPTGRAQKLIMKHLENTKSGTRISIADLVTHIGRYKEGLGVDFGQLMKSAEALAKKGLIKYDSSKSIITASGPKVASYDWRNWGIKSPMVGKKPSGEILSRVGPFWDGGTFVVVERDTSGLRGNQDKFLMLVVDDRGRVTRVYGTHSSLNGAKKFYKNNKLGEEVDA